MTTRISRRTFMAAGGWMMASYGLVAAIGVLSIRVFTELAPPAVFGEANLLLNFLTLAMTTVSTPFTNTQLRYHSAAADGGRGDAFTRTVLTYALGAGAIVGLVAAACWAALVVAGATRLSATGLGAALALGLLTLARGVFFGRVQADRRNRPYAALLVGEALALAGCTAGALVLRPTVDGYVLGQAAGMGVATLLGLAVAPGLGGPTGDQGPRFVEQVRAYGLPFAPMSLLSWLANTVDRYALGALAGVGVVGRYVAPFSIASRGVSLVGGALNDLYRPALFAAANAGEAERGAAIFRQWIVVRAAAAAACVAGLWLTGPWLVKLLLAPAYRDGAMPVLLWVACGYGVQGLIQVVETRLMSLDRTLSLLPPLAAGGLSNLVFSLVLIPREGIVGAAQATTASFLVQGLVTFALLRAALRKP